jgi:alkylation response protein AidB-like acyl-CoA dehydrogenase
MIHSLAARRYARARQRIFMTSLSSLSHAGDIRRLPVPHLVARPDQLDAVLTELTQRFADGAERHDRDASFPFENFAELQRHGLIAAVAPVSEGGGGASLASTRRIVSAVARGEPSTALVLTMTYLTHRSISHTDSRWSPRLRDTLFRSAVADGALANSLRVEPALGSPARGGLPETVARRVGEGWQLSGHKLYTTGIPALSWLAVWARTDEPEPRLGIFLVPRDAPGIQVVESWDHLGLRASGSHEAVFDAVSLPLDHAVDVRPVADWAGGPEADQYAWMIVLLGALYDGIARAARAWLLRFLSERAPGSLGAPLATVPRVQQVVGEIEALLWANDALLTGLVQATDAGSPRSAIESGLVKYTVTGNAIRVVDLALQLSGNHGLSRRNPLERHHRDVLCSRIHTPQNDSILIGAGKLAFDRGLQAVA